MSKIVTLTFSPCIDKSTSVPQLVPEKKLQCATPKLEPGGGGINVARAIKKLGGEAIAIFTSGGYTGKYFNHLLQQENIASISIDTLNETRENIIVFENSTTNQYRFGMPPAPLLESEWKACLQAIEDVGDIEYIVASGSLPPGVPVNIFAQLSAIAQKKHAKLIVDTSGKGLEYAIASGVYFIKPNLSELAMLAGVESVTKQNVVPVARKILLNSKCNIIVISMGMEGAVMITAREVYYAVPPQVVRKSTVGAGDSMVAGITYALFKQMGLQDALSFGVACGTAATTNSGTQLCKKNDADRLFELIKNAAITNHNIPSTRL